MKPFPACGLGNLNQAEGQRRVHFWGGNQSLSRVARWRRAQGAAPESFRVLPSPSESFRLGVFPSHLCRKPLPSWAHERIMGSSRRFPGQKMNCLCDSDWRFECARGFTNLKDTHCWQAVHTFRVVPSRSESFRVVLSQFCPSAGSRGACADGRLRKSKLFRVIPSHSE